MNIRDLHYLVSVAQFCHFGKAANACCVSQPTLSMQIKKLEEQLGVQLIERNNKSVMMTEIGQAIAAHAQQILNGVSAIKEVARSAVNPYSGTVKLGLIPTLGPYLLPHIMPQLTRQFPELSLHLIEEKTEKIVKLLIAGELDAVILALPINEPKLVSKLLFEEQFLLAVSHQHPLATRKRVASAELSNYELLLLEEGHCLREQALELCQKFKSQKFHTFQATSLETLRYMVANGSGITLLPQLACNNKALLNYISLHNPKPSRRIGMLWRKSTPREALFNEIAQLISQEIEQIL